MSDAFKGTNVTSLTLPNAISKCELCGIAASDVRIKPGCQLPPSNDDAQASTSSSGGGGGGNVGGIIGATGGICFIAYLIYYCYTQKQKDADAITAAADATATGNPMQNV